jgi:DNA repair exonuclease SbcCD ATPase subunit
MNKQILFVIFAGAGLLSLPLLREWLFLSSEEASSSPAPTKSLLSPSIKRGQNQAHYPALKEQLKTAHTEQLPTDIKTEIARLETELEDQDAIGRLNAGIVDREEREKLGKQLQRLDNLRKIELEQQLKDLEMQVAELEAHHSDRLRDFGVTP